MRARWAWDARQRTLVPGDPEELSEPGPAEVVIELSVQPVAETDPRASGAGVVTATGEEATALRGLRVIAPAMTPASEERDAELRPVDPGGPTSHIVTLARWVTPLQDGLEVLADDQAAVVSRELADAYALIVAGNLQPGQRVTIAGAGATAELAARLARWRGCQPHRLGAGPSKELDSQAPLLIAGPVPSSLDGLGPASSFTGAALACAAESRPAMKPWLDRSSLTSVVGAHPDLLPELAALVIKGELQLGDLADESVHLHRR